MNMTKPQLLCSAVLMMFLGGLLDHWNFSTSVAVDEPAKAAVVLAPTKGSPEGALILARTPESTAAPAQAVPKGAKVTRVVQATIKPTTTPGADKAADCPPVTVDLTALENKDGSQSYAVSSPDGQVVAGFDAPKQPMIVPAVHKWAAGPSYDSDGKYGAWIDRDFGRLRVGAEVNQLSTGGIGARVKIGFTFW